MKNKLLIGALFALFSILPAYCNAIAKINYPIHTMVDSESVVVAGDPLVNSIVGIAIPTQAVGSSVTKWVTSCTGTILGQDRKWVITAGHCVADTFPAFGNFLPILHDFPLFIVPWQKGGIPPEVYNARTDTTEKYRVQAIYLPYDYSFANAGWEVPILPYPFYIKQDFALLELEHPLPAKYKAIELADKELSRDKILWMTGYGGDATNEIPAKRLLRYRQVYNIGNTIGQPPNNYDQLYTLGSRSKIVYDESGKPLYSEACSITQAGDDGGPILYWNGVSQKYQLVATYSRGMYINSPTSFCAKIPEPYAANVSMVNNNKLIRSIMDDDALPMATKCLGLAEGACNKSFAYVTNSVSSTISLLKKSKKTGGLVKMGVAIPQLYYPYMSLINPNNIMKFLLVMGPDYINSYKINNINGALQYSGSIKTHINPKNMVFDSTGSYLLETFEAYTLNASITLFSFDTLTGELKKRNELPLPNDVEPSAIAVSRDNIVYVTSVITNRIYLYKLSPGGFLVPFSEREDTSVETGESPSDIKISKDGDFAVVVNTGDSTISTYKIEKYRTDRPDGILSHRFTIKSNILNPDQILLKDDYVYIASSERNIISSYLLSYPSGELVSLGITSSVTGGNVLNMNIDDSGKNLYVTVKDANKIVQFSRNWETGFINKSVDSQLTGYYPATVTLSE